MVYISKRVPAALKIKPDWDEVWGFSEGLAVVRTGEKEGYINEDGQWAISPQFDYASPFRQGFSCIKIDGSWGVINTKGELIGRRYFDEVTSLKDGKFWIRSKNGVGSLDENGSLTWLRSMVHAPLGYLNENWDKLSEDFIRNS